MKPSHIFDVLDLALTIREEGGTFNPLFVGPPGVGKSSVVQQWCKRNNMPFIDLRAAYLESPDLIGYPSITTKEGRQITTHNTPEFWPTAGKGVVLLEEPNRGTTAVLNTFMQILTDRAIHTYKLPDGWIIVGCINPETESYDVNVMDAALKNRFEIFEVDFELNTFVQYMKDQDYHPSIMMFVESVWKFVPPEKIVEGGKYVSPRSFSKLQAVLQAGLNKELELTVFQSILGDNYGRAFYSFMHDEIPVLYKDLLDNPKKSLSRLKTYSDPQNYNNAQISITIKDIVKINEIADDLLHDVLLSIPPDQAISLIKELSFARSEEKLVEHLFKKYKDVHAHLRTSLKVGV